MAQKYTLRDGERVRLTRCDIDTNTVIAAGDLVAMSSGLIIKAVTASTAIAWCPDGHAAGSGTICEVTVGNGFTLQGTSDAVFAVAQKGVACDIVNDGTQQIDNDGTSYKVLQIGIGDDAGVVGSAANVTVKINAPLF